MKRKNTDILRRGRTIQEGRRGGGPVIYWVDRDQRIDDNWALLYSQQEAIIREKPLLLLFCLDPSVSTWREGQRNLLDRGLRQLARIAGRYGLAFFTVEGDAEELLPRLAEKTDPHLIITDFSPLRKKRKALTELKDTVRAPIIEVDSHNIIPAWQVSSKREYAAYTIRPKIHRLLGDYLTEFPDVVKHPFPLEPSHTDAFNDLKVVSKTWSAGQKAPEFSEPHAVLESFITARLNHYQRDRNNPNLDGQSNLSPYLHFGHLAPQRVALSVQGAGADKESAESFLEELVVRRELSDNFCLYEQHYDTTEAFSDWAHKTLYEHRKDTRHHTYTLRQFEHGETHEELWNSCQHNLLTTGKLHGYLRMYWAKKILEWSASPEEAMEYAITLNDTYSLDGRDPNGYTGIAWSIGGVHDRAWTERPIFGKIRYMNERGCRRKFDVESYIRENRFV